ncbi:RNA-directed DNA polymerase, eukaryota [Tanacetum coccineum]
MIFKVDFEKAYDSVSWSYLDYFLIHFGLSDKWRGWIMACLQSARTSILVNGSPTKEFFIKRGLRQGGPLSPFLFILVMEGLHAVLKDAHQSRLIKGAMRFDEPTTIHSDMSDKSYTWRRWGINFFSLFYARLFCLDVNEDFYVADHWSNNRWNLHWRRHIDGGRIRDMFTYLTAEIQQIQLTSDEDSWQWLVGKNGVFTVGETRKHIDSFILSVLDTRTTWSKFLLRRINVFMWRLALDRLPHRFHLSRRGFDIDSILCQLCSRAAKTKDHFFSFCEIACDVWRLVRVWCGIFDSHLNSISSWLAWIDGLSSASVKQERMYVILVTSSCISLEASDIAVLIPFL